MSSEKWTEWKKVPELVFTDIIYEKKYHKELGAGVARVTINRPKKMNAFSAHTQDEMWKATYDASHDPKIGVVVLTGAGDRAFSTAVEMWNGKYGV